MSDAERDDLFGQYYLETYKRAYQEAFGITQDRHLAHDAVQEAYVNIFAKLASGEPMPRGAGCVVDLAMKRAKDLLRKQKRQSLSTSFVVVTSLVDKAQYGVCNEPYQELERQELAEQIGAWLQQLSPDHRHAILLSYIHDLPDKEVAQIMGVPVATVKTWLCRAKAKLRLFIKSDPSMLEYLPKGGQS